MRRLPRSDARHPPARCAIDHPDDRNGDASMLQATPRLLRPRRYLEVGGRYGTALALDVCERFLDGAMSVAAVEPHPELLRDVTRPDGPLEFVVQPLRSAPLEHFRALDANDAVFLDRSHGDKTDSDVQHLSMNALPVLADAAHVHVRDIVWRFEDLRHELAQEHRAVVAAELTETTEDPRGAIWPEALGSEPRTIDRMREGGPAMADERNWDDLADEESEWGEPTDVEPVEKAESVASVRLPASVMADARAKARARGMRVGAYLRYLIVQGMSGTTGPVVRAPSVTQFYNGYWEAPTQSVWEITGPVGEPTA